LLLIAFESQHCCQVLQRGDRIAVFNKNRKEDKMMKAVRLTIFLLAAVIGASAQTTAPAEEPAGLKILRVGLQRVVPRSPSLRAVPSTDPAALAQAKNDRTQDSNSDSSPALRRMSQNAEIAPKTSRPDPFGNMPAPISPVFVASMVVKNIGTKPVTAVEWEYLLFEAGATEPVKRYKIQTKKAIQPGEQAELTKEVTPKGQEQQARITRIEYSDGSIWKPK
jgi:hypothetical protein